MGRPASASLKELTSDAQAFADWFAAFAANARKAPLSWSERAMIDAYFDEICEILDEVEAITRRAKNWESEK